MDYRGSSEKELSFVFYRVARLVKHFRRVGKQQVCNVSVVPVIGGTVEFDPS